MLSIFLQLSLLFSSSVSPLTGVPADYFHQSHYNVFKSGKVVGHMVCTRSEKNGVVEYTTESNINVSFIIDVAIYNKVQSSFINGLLYNGNSQRIINGKPKAESHISWSNDKYLVSGMGSNPGELKSRISFSTACLMYTEPRNYQQIYSENFRRFVDIEEVSPHKYALKLPDGNNNYYTYKNGVCVEVEVPTSFATVFIRPGE